MTKNNAKEISDFGQAALALDREFLQIERFARELERLSKPSDKGMERAQTLLAEVEASRERLASQMQIFVKALELARQRNEAAQMIIAERAAMVHERQREGEKLLERFRSLAAMVGQITAANAQFQNVKTSELSPENREALLSHLPQLGEQLGVLIDEATQLMHDSRLAHAKVLEKNADSLRQRLQSLRQRLSPSAQEPLHP